MMNISMTVIITTLVLTEYVNEIEHFEKFLKEVKKLSGDEINPLTGFKY